MSDDKIKDNPSFKKLKKDLDGMSSFSKIINFLSVFGFKDENVTKEFHKLPGIIEQFNLLSTIPDRFNEHFMQYGWIAYEMMNFEIMQKAVQLADKGKFDEAEILLVEYYNEENMKFLVGRLYGIQEFRPRLNLINKALDDYLAERYHSCIPIVLMMIDGVVNDIEQKGFFADGSDLQAWDSIAAHTTGLTELAKLLSKTRRKTTTDTITIPYRNGILHGRDLAYDNKLVAAKAWATLFAVRDWAGSIKEDKKNPKEEPPEPTLRESIKGINDAFKKHDEIKKTRARLEEWKSRTIVVNIDYPETGCSNDYSLDSPEKTVVLFLEYWTKKNYGKMAELTTNFWSRDSSIKKVAGRIREIFEDKRLLSFKISNIKDESPAISEIEISLSIEKKDKIICDNTIFRMIYENEKKDPILRGEKGGMWKILSGYQKIEFI
jgi:hypothetical protein